MDDDDDFEVASFSEDDDLEDSHQEETPAAAPQQEEAEAAPAPVVQPLETTPPEERKPKLNVWVVPKTKGKRKGYFVNALSPEQRRNSQARRSSVQDILSQYTDDLEMD